jgi:hypothetical protein
MSRFRIDHPTNPHLHVIAGADHMLGFFVELRREDRSRPIKSLDLFTLGRAVTLQDCFEFLIEHGFFTGEELHDALIAIQHGEEDVPSGVHRVMDIVMEFKAAD